MEKDNKNKIEVILEDLDETNITSILKKWNEINSIKKSIEELEEVLRNKVRIFLRERQWTRYMDVDTKISVNLDVQKRETVDIKQLKQIVSQQQYDSIVKITTFEKLSIITQEGRQKLKKFIKG